MLAVGEKTDAAGGEGTKAVPQGMRKNGKQWHPPKKAFRPTSGLTSYEQRNKTRVEMAAVKAKERGMKDEKEAERQRRIQALRDRRVAKEEKARFEEMALKMKRKKAERVRRRDKRNKMLSS